MSEHVYKHIELTGSSPAGIEVAVQSAIERTSRTVHNMRWFDLGGTRGPITDGRIEYGRVSVSVSVGSMRDG